MTSKDKEAVVAKDEFLFKLIIIGDPGIGIFFFFSLFFDISFFFWQGKRRRSSDMSKMCSVTGNCD
jgi:hypothetical protein